MKFALKHTNINVYDLDKSLEFYKNALGLKLIKENNSDSGEYKIYFLTDEAETNKLELTWLRDQKEPYDLGANEGHIAFSTDDFDAAYKMHKEMGCICFENTKMGLYFIEDPDGYWIEILPAGRG